MDVEDRYPALENTALLQQPKEGDGPPVTLWSLISTVAMATRPKEAMAAVMKEKIFSKAVELRGQPIKYAPMVRSLLDEEGEEDDEVLWSQAENRENNSFKFVDAIKSATNMFGDFGSRGTFFMIKAAIVCKAVEEWYAKTTKEYEDVDINVSNGRAVPERLYEAGQKAMMETLGAIKKDMIEGILDALRTKTGNLGGDSHHSKGVNLILDERKPKTSDALYQAAIEYETTGQWIWDVAKFSAKVITDQHGWSVKDTLGTNDGDPYNYSRSAEIVQLFEDSNVPAKYKEFKVSKNVLAAAKACELRTHEAYCALMATKKRKRDAENDGVARPA